jgi:hypothetical protein
MIELTQEVRYRAAQAAWDAWAHSSDDEQWNAVVDAVAPILAAYWEAQQREFEYERDMGDDL